MATKKIAEKKVVGKATIVKTVAPENKVTKKKLTSGHKMTERKVIKNNMSAKSITKNDISEDKVAEEKAIGKKAVEKKATDKKVTGKNVTEKKVVDTFMLSDQDILKMSDKDYMNPVQLEFFRLKLLSQEQEILENAKKTTQAFQEQETNYIADPSDRATIEEEYALELRSRDRERKLLQKIRKALDLIELGDYGFCEDTGEPIGLKRLIARPAATLTIEAQERREKMQKHFADS